jgi:uncharacterized protein (DUF1330 family)
MPAYYLVGVREIKDPVAMVDYRARINAVVEQFGGRYVVIGGPFHVLEGSYQPVFAVMIEFPTRQDARLWYESEDYRELKALRLSATVSNAFLMDGSSPSR